MALKELAASLNRRPDLHKHPAVRNFQADFPIIVKRLCFEAGFDDELIDIIRGRGDTQRHKTNVKADMTDWFMQKQHMGKKCFRNFENSENSHIFTFLQECWPRIPICSNSHKLANS